MEENKKNFGLPIVDSTPMGIIGMEGQMYRGIAENKKGRPSWVRVCAILFSFFLLLLPGILFLSIVIFSYSTGFKDGVANIIVAGFFGLLLSGAGVTGIISNLKRPK
jgi:hypothetical protein